MVYRSETTIRKEIFYDDDTQFGLSPALKSAHELSGLECEQRL